MTGFSNLKIIAELINDSVPQTHQYFATGNMEEIQRLAVLQQENGAEYLDVNVGSYSPEMMKKTVQAIQAVSRLPLSIDSPDFETVKAGLEVYDPSVGKPILNSISPLRLKMFELTSIQPFRPILLLTEDQNESGKRIACHSVEETFAAAEKLLSAAAQYGISNVDCLFDPGIAPIGTDLDGNLQRLLKTLEKIQVEPSMQGVHVSVGLSNFTVMLPAKCADGTPVKTSLENAFLTLAVRLGLDYVIGSVKRKHEPLENSHPAMQCLNEFVACDDGYDAITRLCRFYS